MTPSRIASEDHTAVEATPRKRLTLAERTTILDRQHDKCAGCGETLIWTVIDQTKVYGPMIDEHIIPLELGGLNDLSNRELRCAPCAKKKTREDIRQIAKMRRQKAKHETPIADYPPTQKIRSRGFQRRNWGAE